MSSGRSPNGSREQRRLLVERSPAGLYLASVDGSLLDCNEAFATILGYSSREEALAARESVLAGSTLDAGDRPASSVSSVETLLTRRDGATICVLRTESVNEVQGEPVVVGALVDATQARSTADQRRELEEHLLRAQKMEAVGRLAGGIAHDYNNLLAIILNYASLVMDELDEQSPLRKDLGEIHRAAQRAAALTRQLLTMSRRGLTQPIVVDLRTLVTAMEEPLRRIAGTNVDLTLSLGAVSCRVLVDSTQLQQALMNVAMNARDAMPSGGEIAINVRAVHVGVTGRLREKHPELPPGRYVRLVVSDNGSGMSDHVRTRAFDPFFTTKPTGKGAGLGLATAYGIVKQSRGHIAISSQPGKGTQVEIYLPRAARSAAQSTARAARVVPTGAVGGTVLVTDDEDAVLALACRILSQHGYTTLTARGPQEALRVSRQQKGRIDLLLTDILMPGINGKQLADRLLIRRPDMKVLFMSGYVGDALAGNASAALLAKPFTAESLLGHVERLLRR